MVAADAQFTLEAVGAEPVAARGELDAYRARIRRAVREGIQSDCLERLRALGLPEIALPLIIGGVSSRPPLDVLARRLSEAWGSS